MKKILTQFILCIAAALFFASTANAQYYTGVGVRLGKFASGVSFKYFFDANNASAIELIAAKTKTAKGGYVVTGLYECQTPITMPILQLPLDFIAGVGAHVGYYPKRYYKIVEGSAVYYNDNCVAVGIDALIALEYDVPLVWLPFAVGIEAQPFLELVNRGPEFLDFAVTLKYVFNE